MSDSLRFEDLIPTPMKTSTQLLRKKTGESIPSVERDGLQAALAGSLRIGCVPTDAHQNDIDRETHPFGSQRLILSLFSQTAKHRPAGRLIVNAKNRQGRTRTRQPSLYRFAKRLAPF